MGKKDKYNSDKTEETEVSRDAVSDVHGGHGGHEAAGQDGQYEVTRKKRKVWPWILLAAAGAAAATVAVWFFVFNKTVNISDYVSLKYDGIEGFAVPECVVDRDGLYEAMAGNEKNAEKLASYRGFADSVTASAGGDHISNGEDVEVTVSYDEQAREKTKYKVNNTQFTVTAEGIDSGKQTNLFENVSIKISGISPNATMEVVNNNTDEYLKTLVYKTDKSEHLSNGDRVTLSCEVTDDELADHGLTTTSLTAMYDVSGLSEYAQSGKVIPRKLMEDRVKKHTEIIEKETKDDTFRMLYKATGDAGYLTIANNETASDIKQEGIYFLKKKPENKDENASDNKVAFLHSAKVSAGDKSETIYFLFTYDDLFVNADGDYKFITGDEDADYIAGKDKDKLNNDNLKKLESGYTIVTVDISALSDEAETPAGNTVESGDETADESKDAS